MEKELLVNDNHSIWVSPTGGFVFTEIKALPRPTNSLLDTTTNDVIAPWGENNSFPQDVIKDIGKDSDIGSLLNRKAELLYGGGIEVGQTVYNQDTQKNEWVSLPPEFNDPIEEFFELSRFDRYLFESYKDLSWFVNAFPEIVLSRDRSKIVQVCTLAAEECRFAAQNTSTGKVETCYISANWPNAKWNDKLTKALPVLDPYYDPASSLLAGNKTNYIYPLSYPRPGGKIYQLADWNAIRENNWLKILQEIPKMKLGLLTKSMAPLRYHIEVSDLFWENKYKGFNSKPAEEQKKIREGEFKRMSDFLTGAEKSGRVITTSILTDKSGGKEYSMWKITPVEDKMKDGQYLEDGKAGLDKLMSAIAVHPALSTIITGNGMSSSGSNIREAFNLMILTNQFMQNRPLEIFSILKKYNGWNVKAKVRIKNTLMTTLDTGKETNTQNNQTA